MKLLIDNGADVNACDLILRTPLHLCAKNGNLESLKLLLAFMANPYAKTITRKSICDYAKQSNNSDIIIYQLKIAQKQQIFMEFRPENQRLDYWKERVFYKFYNSAMYTKDDENFSGL